MIGSISLHAVHLPPSIETTIMIHRISPTFRRRLTAPALMLAVALASACAANPSGPGGPAPDAGGLMALYNASIASAAVYRPEWRRK